MIKGSLLLSTPVRVANKRSCKQNYKAIDTDINNNIVENNSSSNSKYNKSSATAEDGRPYESG